MNTTKTATTPSRWSLIRWELGWTLVEMAGVGLALALGMLLDYWQAATIVFFAILPVSLIVGYRHYSAVQ